MTDTDYLQLAIAQARESDEPLGCGSVLVYKNGEILASNFNTQRRDNRTAAHAEMKSIEEANKKIGRKLTGVTAYGSCEPCTMCLSALVFAGVERIVFAYRLNELVAPENQIAIDCFKFVEAFPSPPSIEQVTV